MPKQHSQGQGSIKKMDLLLILLLVLETTLTTLGSVAYMMWLLSKVRFTILMLLVRR